MNPKFLLFTAALMCFAFSITEILQILKYRGKTKTVEATIIDEELTLPNQSIVRNSKRVLLEYDHDGRRIISKKPITVSMGQTIGDQINIKYIIDEPEVVVTSNLNRLLVALSVGTLLFVIGYLS